MTLPLVAIEARRLQDRPLGGVGRAIANVLPHLASLLDVVVLVDARRGAVSASAGHVEAVGALAGAPGTWWLHTSVRRWVRNNLRTRPAVFHGTFNAIPFGLDLPAVVTIHDLSFELHDEDFGAAKRRVFQVQARHAARHARKIVVPSAFIREQLVDRYRVDRSRVAVVPHAADPAFSPERARDAAAVAATHGIADPYVVAVGGAPRRGIEVAIEAWREVRRRRIDVDLVIVGETASREAGIHTLGRVDDSTWSALLAGASALVYPSRYEGFGLPALEALASGTPVVCAAVGPLPEILGDAPAWSDSASAASFAVALERLFTDTAFATERRTAGLAHAAARPQWPDIAATFAGVYAEVAA